MRNMKNAHNAIKNPNVSIKRANTFGLNIMLCYFLCDYEAGYISSNWQEFNWTINLRLIHGLENDNPDVA